MSPMNLSRTTRLALALLPLSGAAILFTAVLVTAALTPGYSHTSQFISELGAAGAHHEWAFRLFGFLPAGVLLVSFCVVAHKALPRSRSSTLGLWGLAIVAAGYLAAVVFPCDLGCRPDNPSTSQVIHNISGAIGYLLAPGVLFLLARASRTSPGSVVVEWTGYLAALVALVSLPNITPDSSTLGLSQRTLELAVLGWVSLWGIQLARQRA